MDNFSDSATSPLLEKIKNQAEVLIPLHGELVKRMGQAEADNVIRAALSPWAQSLGREIRKQFKGEPLQQLKQAVMALDKQGVQETEFLESSATQLNYHIRRCDVAEFYRKAGLERLGALFVCDIDFQLIRGLDENVRLERPETLMLGGRYCDFRFSKK